MSICYKNNETGVIRTQKQLVEWAAQELAANPTQYKRLARLLSADTTKQTEVVQKIEELTSVAKTLGIEYEGVSHFLEQKHPVIDGEPEQYLAPQYIKENYIQHYIKQNVSEGKSATLAEQEIRAQIADSAMENQMGTMQHALIQALFDTKGDTTSKQFIDVQMDILKHLDDTKNSDGIELENGRTLRDIVTQGNPELTDSRIIQALTNNALTVYQNITSNPAYNNAKFIAECDLYGDDSIKTSDIKYKGLKGRADLIVIKEDGTVDIIDFKVCTRPYTQWCTAKQYHTEYQLGVYRQLLSQHGIDGSKVGLYIQPIFLNKNNAEDTNVETIQNVLKMSALGSAYPRLHWKFGYFQRNIRKLIPDRISMSIEEAVHVNDKAIEGFNKMIDYNPVEKSFNKQDIIDRKLKDTVQNNERVYYFYDSYEHRVIKNTDRDFFIKDGGVIDQYIAKMRNVKNENVRDLFDAIEQYKADPKKFDPSNFDFLKTKGKGQLETIMNSIFGEFTKWYYKPLDIPVFIDNGILAFYNEKTQSCHFIVITDQSLTAPYAEGKYGSIFGNFYTNDQVRALGYTEVLPAECQYAEMIKAMHIINMVCDENPEYFKGKSIGSLQVINPMRAGENNSLPVDTLRRVYSILCEKTKTPNHFEKELLVSDPWIDFGFQLKLIEQSGKQSDHDFIGKFVSDFNKNNRLTTFDKIQRLIKLRSAMEKHYTKYQIKDFQQSQYYDKNNPIDNLFITVSELIMYYQKIPIDPSGNFDKYGFNGRSIMEILGLPWVSNQALGNRGVGNGLFMSSAENSPSPTLRALSEYYQAAFSHIREEFQKQHKIITKITIPYISRYNSQASRLLSGVDTNKWEKLLVKDSTGKISDALLLINPYQNNNLTNEDVTFLKAILWEINKYRFKDQLGQFMHLTYDENAQEIEDLIHYDDNLIKLISSGRYFELPLKRARYFERWKKVGRTGLFKMLNKELETLKDDWDLTYTHQSHRSAMMKELQQNATTMYNQYNLSPEERDYIIKEEGAQDFELDLDLLAMDVAFQTIREDYFENVLQTTAACATVLHVNQALTGINRHPELEALDVRQKTALKNQSDIKPEMESPAKVVTALRKLNSVLALAFRPLQMVKEITFGQFTNYSRVFGTLGSSDKLTIKSVFNANKVIWGQSIGKWAQAFTSDIDIASYTLCETLNKIYGIANEDISQTVNNSMTSRHGILANLSKYMYIFNSAPDYFNRLTLFIAKMMEDGCFEAHSLDKDGNLVYDFKKDNRFSELNKYGLNSNYRGEEYLKQKGLYIAMCEQFQLEGRNFMEYDKNGKVIYKEFDRAYTTKQRNSIKEVADMAYGYYDHETKSLVDLGFFGLVYKQFQIFLTAKMNLWLKGRPSTKGDNTSQGSFKIVTTEKGEKCYRRLILDSNSNIVDVKIVPESALTEEEKNTLDYAYTWEGDYVEGLVYSIGMTLHDLFRLNFSEIRKNKYRLGNVALALHDLLIGMLLFAIFKWLFSKGTKKMQDIKPLQRVLVRAMGDVSPSAITSMTWEPGFYSTVVNLRDDAIKLFTNDDPDITNIITRRIGALRDWSYNDHD